MEGAPHEAFPRDVEGVWVGASWQGESGMGPVNPRGS